MPFCIIYTSVKIIIKIRWIMKQGKKKLYTDILDPQSNIDEIYEPLISHSSQIAKRQPLKSEPVQSSKSLFPRSQVDLNVLKPIRDNQAESEESTKDSFISKIINNTKNPKRTVTKVLEDIPKETPQEEYFCFNTTVRLTHPQTPHFKSLLQSPFSKFNSCHKIVIDELIKDPEVKYLLQPIQMNSDPNQFYDKKTNTFLTAKYLVGLGLNLKQRGFLPECLFFIKLACYCEPFNDKVWKKYISLEQQQGNLYKAFDLSKTAFLFTHQEEFAKTYLINGEKCGVSMRSLRGLLSSISNPEEYDKGALPESAKLQLKYSKIWKGIKILYEICRWNQFRLAVCSHIIFLAKFLENIGYRKKAMILLKRSFNKSMSKLEVYTNYFEMNIRQNNGHVREEDIREMKMYIDNISNQNKYKLNLEVAEILFNLNDERYKEEILNSFKLAIKYCAPGTGSNKALKQIYFSVVKWKGICPPVKPTNDHVVFETNRYFFINDINFIEDFEFSDWKYFLHYGIRKNDEILYAASKKWPHTGRLIAEWIHALRTKKSPLTMLKIWRQKIDEVPKSGQLWCQGGRIYAQLHEYTNALKCFKSAIHFTPQYGDSFIQQLRIYLQQSQFLQIQRSKKIFLVSEPFYGHVLSYLKLNHSGHHRISMNEVWENAVSEIKKDLYRTNTRTKRITKKLTAYEPYNHAYQYQETTIQKERLFSSYQQMENKN